METNEMPKLTLELDAQECAVIMEVLKGKIAELKENISEVETFADMSKVIIAHYLIDLRDKIGAQATKKLGTSIVELN